jgi:hypothetical protein
MSFRQGRLAGFVAIALADQRTLPARLRAGLDYEANLAAISTQNEVEYARILATDGPARPYGRNFTGNLCAHHGNGCAGDIRYYGWGDSEGATVNGNLFSFYYDSPLWVDGRPAPTCAPLRAARWRPTGSARSPPLPPRGRRDGGGGRTQPMSRPRSSRS